jgi:hypothetical protein
MPEETPEQVTLDDLPSLDHAGVDSSDLFTSCPRCECAVSKSPGAFEGHERWHAAIEAAADPRLSQLRRVTLDQAVTAWRYHHSPAEFKTDEDSCAGHREFINRVWQIATEAGHESGTSVTDFLRDQLAERRSAAVPTQTDQPLRDQMIQQLKNTSIDNPAAWVDLLIPVIEPHMERYLKRADAEAEACRVALVNALEHPAEDTTFEQAVELVETLIDDRRRCREQHTGLWRGEVERLRRIEQALIDVGAPNRSERGDPGGLVVRWIQRQADLMRRQAAELAYVRDYVRPERDRLLDEVRKICELLGAKDVWHHTYTCGDAVRMVEAIAPESGEVEQLTEAGPVTAQALSDLLLLVGVTVTPEQLASWTPGQREQAAQWAGLVHLSASDNDVDVPERPAFLDRPAEIEQVCPSLYLHDGTLLTCCGVPGHPAYHVDSAETVTWTDEGAVPSPWPVDREPPAGITLLRDTDAPGAFRYLYRVAKHWVWSDKPAIPHGPYQMLPWAEAVLEADGDLVVVRP